MSKVRVQIFIDMSTGLYDINFANVTNPGTEIDVLKVLKACEHILMSTAQKAKEGSVLDLYETEIEHN